MSEPRPANLPSLAARDAAPSDPGCAAVKPVSNPASWRALPSLAVNIRGRTPEPGKTQGERRQRRVNRIAQVIAVPLYAANRSRVANRDTSATSPITVPAMTGPTPEISVTVVPDARDRDRELLLGVADLGVEVAQVSEELGGQLAAGGLHGL